MGYVYFSILLVREKVVVDSYDSAQAKKVNGKSSFRKGKQTLRSKISGVRKFKRSPKKLSEKRMGIWESALPGLPAAQTRRARCYPKTAFCNYVFVAIVQRQLQ